MALGSATCTLLAFNHTVIVCSVPQGQGILQSVSVTVGGQASNQVSYNYDTPVISAVLPNTADTVGTPVVLTLIGTNFGTGSGMVVCWVGVSE